VREIILQPAWLRGTIARLLYALSDRVVTVSGAVRDHLIETQPRLARKTVVVHDGMDATSFVQANAAGALALRETWGVSSDDLVVGMVGRISSWKGQELLLRAAAMAMRQQPGIHVILVGGNVPGEEWREENLRALIGELGIADRVVLAGFRLDIPEVMASFDVFCLPSTRPDPFPGVVLEAMAAGKPVVATAHGGPLEEVVDGETGFLVSPHDPTEMAAAIERLRANPDLRQAMGQAGRQRVLVNFTTRKYVEGVEAVYRDLIGEGDVAVASASEPVE
jgi:glycosyltransferase involved in cell wall biosynthesis